jgi:glyoxylase-like metal-dependent hydrolase (beta-lactamase superfamily II)
MLLEQSISHLHWDHAFNNHIFPNAEFFVQRKELQYAIAPLPVHMRGYESIAIGMKPNYIINTKYTIIDGDREIIPGVSVILTPGHTPGSMAVIVGTNKGKWAIAGDTVPLYENWNNPDKHIPHLPGGVFINLMDLCQSIDRIEKEADFVLPSHDIGVFKQEAYP